ncbi:hypothetical protein ACFPFP_32120 [Bradyrhizobium sp. GCM10023182]|uniref:Polysaccharide chain length determinant N-terminal domain-containing protein n=1 Tax=Bradyrhizobium zhengyangense TaxID=2911009 RepID=A0ABS9LX26_9BRAD|nr:hypothetical protein [Bradyrhizobium zhengyangense]MCG2671587.1 hypothetical protein [Bradyrhizobium zhengyangense]
MTDKATVAILGTLRSFRVTFLSVAGATFVVLAAAIIISVQPSSLVRSAIEVGTFATNDGEVPLEPPELLAKRIPAVYLPAAITALAKSGVQASTLGALQNSSAESIGQTVSMRSIVNPAAVAEAKELQQKIIDQIMDEESNRSDVLREAAALRTVLWKETSDEIDRQIADYGKIMDRLSGLLPEAESLLRARQLERGAALQQRAAAQAEDGNKTTADIDGLRKEIANQLDLLAVLSEERAQSTRDVTMLRARHDVLAANLIEAQIAARAFKGTRVTLAPEAMPIPVGAKRSSLLFIAAVASILIAFGSIAFLHNFAVTRD